MHCNVTGIALINKELDIELPNLAGDFDFVSFEAIWAVTLKSICYLLFGQTIWCTLSILLIYCGWTAIKLGWEIFFKSNLR